MRRPLGQLRRSDEGTALVEASVVIPIAIVIFIGLIDFGRAYFTLATAQKSTRDAVRYLTTLPPGTICGWGLTRAKNLARYGNIAASGNALVPNWTATQITLKQPNCSSPVTAASIVQIQADVPFTPLVWPAIGLPSSMTLKVDYQARWIGG
jgi:hypothetical protein